MRAGRPKWMATLAIAALVTSAGCGSTTATPTAGLASPPDTSTRATTPATPAASTATPTAPMSSTGTPTPTDTAVASPSATELPIEPNTPEPLPEPSLTDPFDVGGALYDPNNVAQGVVSLLDLMGVEIVASDGTVIHPGADRGAGRISLTEGEVRGLIEMGKEDLAIGGEGGGPYTMADLYDGVSASLPGLTQEAFVAAYSAAYAAHPDGLAPQVMLGQPIEAATALTRVQLWLLLVDGFLGPDEATGWSNGLIALSRAMPALVAAGPASLGTANAALPQLVSPGGLTDAEYAELVARLPTLAYTVDFFVAQPGTVHEGHGQPGRQVTAVARYSVAGGPIVASTGRVLLEPSSQSLDGLPVTWRSDNESVLRSHGTLSGSLGSRLSTDGGGTVRIGYTPKKEKANGQGLVATDQASLYATVSQLDLVDHAYTLGRSAALAAIGLVRGTRNADNPSFAIQWHELNSIRLDIRNDYDNTIPITVGIELVNIHRVGVDEVEGVLTLRAPTTHTGVSWGREGQGAGRRHL